MSIPCRLNLKVFLKDFLIYFDMGINTIWEILLEKVRHVDDFTANSVPSPKGSTKVPVTIITQYVWVLRGPHVPFNVSVGLLWIINRSRIKYDPRQYFTKCTWVCKLGMLSGYFIRDKGINGFTLNFVSPINWTDTRVSIFITSGLKLSLSY